MVTEPDKTQTRREPDADEWAVMRREMNTRDADAVQYDRAFFTPFQDAVEISSYHDGLKGPASHRGLDVGVGTGRTLEAMTSQELVGIDLSRDELVLCRERFGKRIELIQASATHLPFREGAFDQILCAGVMLHLPGDDMRRLAVEEMGRVTSRPARIVVATHAYPLLVKMRYPKHRVHHELSWYRFDADELEGLLRRVLQPARVSVAGVCHLPRWRIGNKLGDFGVKVDRLLSKVPGLKYLSGTLLVASVETLPTSRR